MTSVEAPAMRRRRPRLTVGVMMGFVLAVGGALGWITRRARVQHEAVAAIVRAGGSVIYDYEWMNSATKPPGPAWLRGLIGRDYFDSVYGVSADTPAVDDAVVAQIGRLTRVRFLGLQGSTVTDAGLAGLAGMHGLRTLHLRAPNVDGAGFRHLSGLRDLQNLHLYQTPVTDENLAFLVALTAIERLSFSSTRITDAGLTHVARLAGLKSLGIGSSAVGNPGLRNLGRNRRPIRITVEPGTRITPEGIAAAKSLAPELTIIP